MAGAKSMLIGRLQKKQRIRQGAGYRLDMVRGWIIRYSISGQAIRQSVKNKKGEQGHG